MDRRRSPSGSTTCCCRSSRASARSGRTSCSPLSLQAFGGSGYLQDYPIEQYIRDAKIDTLYEGTTAIQGLDLFFRKIVRDQGEALTTLAERDQGASRRARPATARLKAERDAARPRRWPTCRRIVGAIVGYAIGAGRPKEIYKVGQNTTRLLLCLGDLVVGWLLLRQAAVAPRRWRHASAKDVVFYQGKIAAAKFFAYQFPMLAASARSPRAWTTP